MLYLVKPPPDSAVKAVRQICGAQHEHTGIGAVDPLDLHQELGLDAPCGLTLTLASGATESVDLLTEAARSQHNDMQGHHLSPAGSQEVLSLSSKTALKGVTEQ